jgi:hypothetical protein
MKWKTKSDRQSDKFRFLGDMGSNSKKQGNGQGQRDNTDEVHQR